MPKSISGWLALRAAMAKPPEPCMPMVPVSKVAWKLAPVSASALSGMTPFSHMERSMVSTSLTPVPSIAGPSAELGSRVAPEAHIMGAWVKMLQPPHEPEK